MSPYVQLLYRALTSPLGIIVMHENPESARAQFSSARKKHGDPSLRQISITILEGQPNRLYLVKCLEPPPSLSSESTSGSPEKITSG